jgi:hypothetical protein
MSQQPPIDGPVDQTGFVTPPPDVPDDCEPLVTWDGSVSLHEAIAGVPATSGSRSMMDALGNVYVVEPANGFTPDGGPNLGGHGWPHMGERQYGPLGPPFDATLEPNEHHARPVDQYQFGVDPAEVPEIDQMMLHAQQVRQQILDLEKDSSTLDAIRSMLAVNCGRGILPKEITEVSDGVLNQVVKMAELLVETHGDLYCMRSNPPEYMHDLICSKQYGPRNECPVCRRNPDPLATAMARVEELERQVEAFKAAAMLDVNGDPGDVTPDHIEREIRELRTRANAFAEGLKKDNSCADGWCAICQQHTDSHAKDCPMAGQEYEDD